jgi:hypothetical protein
MINNNDDDTNDGNCRNLTDTINERTGNTMSTNETKSSGRIKRVYTRWDDVITQFAKGSTDARMGARYDRCGRRLSKGNCFIEGDKLYSYGQHYTLAMRLNPTENAGVNYLINGDQSFATTNAQSNQCIRSLHGNVQIPFSALRSAGVIGWDRKFAGDFRIVHNLADSWILRKDSQGRQIYSCVVDGKIKYLIEGVDVIPELSTTTPVSDHTLGAVLFHANSRLYLSGMDNNERRHYFLTRLREGSAVTMVEEAYEDLKPEPVKDAEREGLGILRQGDVFFIPSTVTSRDFKEHLIRDKQLLGTSHWATEKRQYSKDSVCYARGCVTHRPDHGGPHHRRLKLGDGKQWYRAVKNTADGSWEVAGGVD